ncbi:hypothetical protein OC835_006834 [Tilletia horrida]|nr:hypothetical protein OC835_006834 [Tilletia horrida]
MYTDSILLTQEKIVTPVNFANIYLATVIISQPIGSSYLSTLFQSRSVRSKAALEIGQGHSINPAATGMDR